VQEPMTTRFPNTQEAHQAAVTYNKRIIYVLEYVYKPYNIIRIKDGHLDLRKTYSKRLNIYVYYTYNFGLF
jgi:hypothetical protein